VRSCVDRVRLVEV